MRLGLRDGLTSDVRYLKNRVEGGARSALTLIEAGANIVHQHFDVLTVLIICTMILEPGILNIRFPVR